MFIGRTDFEAETPILWPPDKKNWLIWKDPDAGKDWRQEEKGTTENAMAGWHHCLDGHESEWTLGVGDGLGGLACCDSWGGKESDMTEWLNWTELNWRKESSVSQISSMLRVCHCLSRCGVCPQVGRAEILNIWYLLAQFLPLASTSTPEWRVLEQEGSVPLQSMGHYVDCGFPATDWDQSSFDELLK